MLSAKEFVAVLVILFAIIVLSLAVGHAAGQALGELRAALTL